MLPVVLHVLPVDVARGAQTYARQLCSALDCVGAHHRIAVIFGSSGNTLAADFSLGVPDGRMRAAGCDPRAVRRLHKLVRDLDPAVVLVHGGEPLKYAALARVPRARLAYYKIGGRDARLHGAKKWFHRAALRRVRAAAAVSDDAARELEELGVPAARIVVIPNGRDPEAYRPRELRARGARTRLVFVGRLDATKRPERFVSLARELRADGCEIDAAIAGTGPQLRAVQDVAIAAGVEVLGAVDDVPELLAATDLLVFPGAPPEGMPGVLIEAGLAGLPVVTTAVPGATDVVVDGETGFVVAVDDFPALVQCARRLVEDAALRERFGTAARARCAERFSLATSARRWRELLEPMIGPPCTSST